MPDTDAGDEPMNAPELPCFLDCEASSLGDRSYPVEVAWSLPDGTVEAHLISPADVPEWTDWSRAAEQVHGISRERLVREGEMPRSVARRMHERLAGRVVYTDAPAYDGYWLAELFRRCWMRPEFELRHAEADLILPLLAARVSDPDALRGELLLLKERARAAVAGRRHRAADDVRYLVELWRLATGAASEQERRAP